MFIIYKLQVVFNISLHTKKPTLSLILVSFNFFPSLFHSGGHHPVRQDGLLHQGADARAVAVVLVLRHRHTAVGPTDHHSADADLARYVVVSADCKSTENKLQAKCCLFVDGDAATLSSTRRPSIWATSASTRWTRTRSRAPVRSCGSEASPGSKLR